MRFRSLFFSLIRAFLLLYQGPFHDGKVTGSLSLSPTLSFSLPFSYLFPIHLQASVFSV